MDYRLIGPDALRVSAVGLGCMSMSGTYGKSDDATSIADLREFMIGDTVQKLFPDEGIYAARVDVPPPPGNPPLGQVKLWPIDYDAIEKEAKTLKDRFSEIFQ